jgi:hypothetical protein
MATDAGLLREGETIELVACPSCGRPSVSGGACFSCGWMDPPADGSAAALGPPTGLVFEPTSAAFVLVQRSWRSRWTLYWVFGWALAFSLSSQQLLNGWFAGAGVSPWWAAVSAALCYVLVARLVERTVIKVSAGRLEVARGPLYLPWSTSFALGRSELRRVEAFRERVDHEDRTFVEYVLRVVTDRGRTRTLVSFFDEDQANRVLRFLQKTLQLGSRPEPLTPEAAAALLVSPAAASRVSLVYRIVLLSLTILSALCFLLDPVWRFDVGYWALYGAATLGALVVFLAHHRKHLRLWDSLPLGPGEQRSSVVAYLVLIPGLTLVLTPLLMVLYGVLRWAP